MRRIGGGRFEIGALIGKGGMGTVHEGVQVGLGRKVAIKLLHAVEPRALERFRREATLAAQLDHPNIVQTIDLVVEDGEPPAIVMELVRGEALASIIAREAPLAPKRAIAIAAQMLSALSTAHTRGIVHRDIKPRNVLVGEGDRVKVVDFGLVKAMHEEPSGFRTTTGTILGTPAYMAPEQIMDERNVDTRTDVHAVGACLYEMLSGKRAFRGSDQVDLMAAVCTTVPTPLAEVRPEVSRALSDVVARAMAKAPADRFASAEEMRVALDTVSPGPIVEAAARAPVREEKRAARTFLVSLGVVLGLGAVGLTVWWRIASGPASASASASASAPAPAPASASASASAPAFASASTSASASVPASASASASASTLQPGSVPRVAPIARCGCDLKMSGGTWIALCTEKMTPQCTCAATGRGELCSVPFSEDGRCNAKPFGGPGKTSGMACEGFPRRGPGEADAPATGSLHCSLCYGMVPNIVGVAGTPCTGYLNERQLTGVVRCN